jgi:hypothetical protein
LSISDDVDVDRLISRLAGPLAPNMRQAFRDAAAEALARVPCLGEGAAYRAVASLQHLYFTPPTDCRAGWDISFERIRASKRDSKLLAASAIGYGGDQRHVRSRPRKAVR